MFETKEYLGWKIVKENSGITIMREKGKEKEVPFKWVHYIKSE